MEFIPITFQKLYEERLDEYNKIFSICEYSDGYTPVFGLIEMWSTYMELSIGHIKSWQAIWNLSRQQCSIYNLPFPCIVVGIVNNIDFVELKATLGVMYVEDAVDDNFPSIVTVPLKDLYPTTSQHDSDTSDSIRNVAECIDQMRLFFNYLWRPWDEIENPIEWSHLYLQTRLQLYYNLNFPSNLTDFTKNKICSLIKETKETYNKVQSIIKNEISTKTLPDYIEHLSKQCLLMYELDMLEDPESKFPSDNDVVKCVETNGIIIVKEKCSLKEYLKHMEKLQIIEPDSFIKYTTSNLQEGLVRVNVNDTIFITSGKHKMQNICYIKYGGCIQGLNADNRPIITDDHPDKALIECRDAESFVTLCNLILEITNCNDILVALMGVVSMRNVFVNSINKRKIISVYSGAKLMADSCEFRGTTIVCFPGAVICLTRCIFEDDVLAVKVHNGGELKISKCATSAAKQPIVEYLEV